MAAGHHEIDANFEAAIQHINLEKLRKPLVCPPFIYQSRYLRLIDYINCGDAEIKRKWIRTCILEDKKEFVFLLLHTAQYNAALIIEPSVKEIIDSKLLDPRNENNAITCPYILSDIKQDILHDVIDAKAPQSNAYKLTRSPRGYCLLINNYLTYGTFKETQRFRNIFYQLHFDVVMKQNLSAAEIMELLQTLSADNSLGNHEAFVCIIISHGTNKSEILGFDNGFGEEPIKIDTICQIFNDTNCPKLMKKPRIFIFNCCRGDSQTVVTTDGHSSIDARLNVPAAQSVTQWKPELPLIIDFLICYSTMDGYAAYVNWNDGTVFGGVLLKFLVEKAYSRDLNSILTRTNNILSKMEPRQPFDWKQSLRKDFVFNPGFPRKIDLQ